MTFEDPPEFCLATILSSRPRYPHTLTVAYFHLFRGSILRLVEHLILLYFLEPFLQGLSLRTLEGLRV